MRFSLFAAALSVLCASHDASAKTLGVSITSDGDPFLTRIVEGVKKRAVADGYTLKMTDGKANAAKQIEDLKSLVAEHPEALIVRPVDSDSGKSITQVAASAKIPLVYVNSEPVNIDSLPENQVFVGSDERLSGTLQTQEVCRLLGGKGRVVVMMGELFHPAARRRTQDVTDVLRTEACNGITIVERQEANWSRSDAATLMTEWLKAGVKFDAIIANNDEMALGALASMKAEGLDPASLVVAGIDGSHDALDAMKDGTLKVTVFQNAPGQGAGAVEAASQLISGQKIGPFINIPFELVTANNRDRFATHD